MTSLLLRLGQPGQMVPPQSLTSSVPFSLAQPFAFYFPASKVAGECHTLRQACGSWPWLSRWCWKLGSSRAHCPEAPALPTCISLSLPSLLFDPPLSTSLWSWRKLDHSSPGLFLPSASGTFGWPSRMLRQESFSHTVPLRPQSVCSVQTARASCLFPLSASSATTCTCSHPISLPTAPCPETVIL